MLGKTLLKNRIKKFGLSYSKFIFEQSAPYFFLIQIFNISAELFFIMFFNIVFPSINHFIRTINPLIKWFMTGLQACKSSLRPDLLM